MDPDAALTGLNVFMGMKLYIQLAIPCGYLGYILSRCGISDEDKPITIIFLSSVFALISILAFVCSAALGLTTWISTLLSISAPVAAAIIWRKWLHGWAMNHLREWGVCNSTQFPLIWSEITQNSAVGLTQVTVYLKNGNALSCSNIYEFSNAPLRWFRSDKKGNVALYVTDERKPGEKFQPAADEPKIDVATSPFNYFRLTYVPCAEIERIEFVTNHPTFS